MRYISTRGGIQPISFKDAVMMGLATDGGLLLPESYPRVTERQLEEWRHLSYPELALQVISPFVDDIPAHDLKELIDRSYATFNHPEVTPVVRQNGVHILELFHGPTLAFKDVALQFLGNLFEYILAERGQQLNIVGATSGDTGSAAIHGVRGKKGITIFIMHPHGKTSPVQALQMTTVTDDNVHNIAIRGTFDDCQNMVKALFNDLAFKEKYCLGAVNSINWARVLAQVVYYAYAWLRATDTGRQPVSFSVPTGNFGDIFAGYVAKRIGVPIDMLVLATNENNILTRFVNNGDYSLAEVVATASPSMDIQLASNFERYLFHLYNEDPARVRKAFDELKEKGRISFSADEMERVRSDFRSASVDQGATLETIGSFYRETGYLLDPHTAVGVRAALDLIPAGTVRVCLATAHPAKFGEAVERAIAAPAPLPPAIAALENLPTRCEIMDADLEQVRQFFVSHVS
ncbi:threonine synthase [Geobacter sp. SVR]|uniref:threonine synthase n=1 Tax=Geobacter sp. SVR TaxID=2495594 RepID=UPI00143EFED4|nr:threonine synthase [Geobacter sp. SVR]BCS53589.1 threonine synthase [Geobacter sp. SVR]GCF84214.1 threonine synthase [Geobacter sp. SVR]